MSGRIFVSSKRKSLASPSLSLTVTKTTSRHFCARNASLIFFPLPPFCWLPIGSQVPICKSGERRKSGFVDCLEKPLGEPSQLLRRRLTFLLQPHVLLLQLLNLKHIQSNPAQAQDGFWDLPAPQVPHDLFSLRRVPPQDQQLSRAGLEPPLPEYSDPPQNPLQLLSFPQLAQGRNCRLPSLQCPPDSSNPCRLDQVVFLDWEGPRCRLPALEAFDSLLVTLLT